ncbi:tRNA nucleotidyltransferase [gamma proteobacterium HdN1]|nr:tRNA nucleotidyltransferase [gamma proteobacterium HdN1]
MQIFLVGGAVRDQLINKTTHDRDWVVVGASPAEMLALGYQQVGRDFPVFLHPKSKEEHALARTERKTAAGYGGFDCYTGSDVTLEEDLLRRDLTINAMAQTEDGTIIDPYGGRRDLEARILRHVSPAFSEDPLRVLRVARFQARYANDGFRIADETLALMQTIVTNGEIEHLTAERVWSETARALLEPSPQRYFETLRECGALAILLPELNILWGIPQPEKYHPEIDTGVHTMMALQQGTRLCERLADSLPEDQSITQTQAATALMYAILTHDLGKGLTPRHEWPTHHGHERLSAHLANKVSDRLGVPALCRQLAAKTAEYHTHCHRAFELRPATVMRTLEALDYLRRPAFLNGFLLACEADARGRTGYESEPYPQADYFYAAAANCRQIKASDIQDTLGFNGKALGEELRKRRIRKIEQVRKDFISLTSAPTPTSSTTPAGDLN